jgi:DNA-binding LacI/PurR family transcriptional regulator
VSPSIEPEQRLMTSTIKDVAAHAGCSIATVSRALNAPHTVNARTLARVRASIDVLAFRPSALGRQLRAERTGLAGVVVPTLANPVFADSLQGIDEAAAANGYRLMLMTTEYDARRERRAIETMREQRVDGLIVTVADADANPLLDELDAAGLPYVLAHNETDRRPAVSVDNRRAARDGVRALIRQGHRRVLMLAGTLAASDRARLRYRGYADAMQEAGLTPLPVLEVDFNVDELALSVLSHLTHPATRPTALFCSNDLLAMVVMRALRRERIDVPGDMSILGFDGLRVGEMLSPSLASIATPNRDIGRAAWQCLMQRIHTSDDAPAISCAGGTTPPLPRPAYAPLPHHVTPGASIGRVVHAASTLFPN